ncbi:helix-turn-helix transcriptional regulator [Streptomyces sp. VRA16 Mangrove soil]|uniref:helix-turn-helix transcriptional regulator n=1 Tax=Streptomyces sp. VRA16 Mangrove soil TaxID=2817434 RepID=UPI001A9DE027|nr:helix-turn-helix transcriptional regulator [Streptomyces sp. VRA16 Mangrove soil]MBO1333655.1 helix-turn-helix transcriptional regulator [Streptomyces sp. VRA16 Mangrove soil]
MTEWGGTADGRHDHGVERLCDAGNRLYSEALRAGRLPRDAAEEAPCLVRLALLYTDPRDSDWLVPVPPQQAMAGALRSTYEAVAEGHRRLGATVEALSRYAELDIRSGPDRGVARLLEGKERIQEAVDEAGAACEGMARTIQPGGIRSELDLAESAWRLEGMRERGVRMRTLYTHVARHGLGLHEYLDMVGDVVEVRTLDEVPERLMAFDSTVAYVPANADRTLALEIRHPALVAYLVTVFDRLWRLAMPTTQRLPGADSAGITHQGRAIAALLAEGHTDAVVAERLGMNVRTCRAHIARLAETLGASNRTQLGVRIAQSGLADPEPSSPGTSPVLIQDP